MTTQAERAEMRARISAAQRQTALVGDASLFAVRLALAADAPAYVSALLADIEERDGLLRQVLFSIERARHEDVSADRCFDCTEWPDLPHHPECLITRIRAVLE